MAAIEKNIEPEAAFSEAASLDTSGVVLTSKVF